ncbi:hypothetical protein D3C86_433470 [compost metagenome]
MPMAYSQRNKIIDISEVFSSTFSQKKLQLQILQFVIGAFTYSLNKDYFTSIILFFVPIPFSLKGSNN